MTEPSPRTADLCDRFPHARVADAVFRDFGGRLGFSGPAVTVRVHEDNVLVLSALERPGDGQVLVVDGGGSLACALAGDRLAGLAQANGWAGLVINGCIRDSVAVAEIPIGVKALAINPRKSGKGGEGETDVDVTFAGVTFRPGRRACSPMRTGSWCSTPEPLAPSDRSYQPPRCTWSSKGRRVRLVQDPVGSSSPARKPNPMIPTGRRSAGTPR